MQIAGEAGRLHVVGWRLSLFEMSGFAVAGSFFLQMLQDYGTDQVAVQRMLVIKKPSGVVKASIFNAGTDVVMIALLLFIGLGLFAFYQNNPGLAPGSRADSVLPLRGSALGLLRAALLLHLLHGGLAAQRRGAHPQEKGVIRAR